MFSRATYPSMRVVKKNLLADVPESRATLQGVRREQRDEDWPPENLPVKW
jgi:hypothetical protein